MWLPLPKVTNYKYYCASTREVDLDVGLRMLYFDAPVVLDSIAICKSDSEYFCEFDPCIHGLLCKHGSHVYNVNVNMEANRKFYWCCIDYRSSLMFLLITYSWVVGTHRESLYKSRYCPYTTSLCMGNAITTSDRTQVAYKLGINIHGICFFNQYFIVKRVNA